MTISLAGVEAFKSNRNEDTIMFKRFTQFKKMKKMGCSRIKNYKCPSFYTKRQPKTIRALLFLHQIITRNIYTKYYLPNLYGK